MTPLAELSGRGHLVSRVRRSGLDGAAHRRGAGTSSLNRLNVATSRAQCLAVVVAGPGLLGALCRTPRQMQLANALSRLVEVSP